MSEKESVDNAVPLFCVNSSLYEKGYPQNRGKTANWIKSSPFNVLIIIPHRRRSSLSSLIEGLKKERPTLFLKSLTETSLFPSSINYRIAAGIGSPFRGYLR
jgi:hypothetical protein